MARTLIVSDRHNSFFSANNIRVGNRIPTEGNYVKGDIIVNIGENTATEAMWICVESGNPGIWEVVGAGAGSGEGLRNKLVCMQNNVVVNGPVTEVMIGIEGFNKDEDMLMVFENETFLTRGVDYEINTNGNGIVPVGGEVWNNVMIDDWSYTFVVFKDIPLVEGEYKIGMDLLADDVKKAIQDASNIYLSGYAEKGEIPVNVSELVNDAGYLTEHQDLSGYATKEEVGGKVAQDAYDVKIAELEGRVNEAFTNANNGKQLIANAIGEPLNAEDTFSAMSNDINGLLSTFKTNMMNNGVMVNSNDKFKQLIDKISTMVEEGSGKGIQFASGNIPNITTQVNETKSISLPLNGLTFQPTYLFITIKTIAYDFGSSSYDTASFILDNIITTSTVKTKWIGPNNMFAIGAYISNITNASCTLTYVTETVTSYTGVTGLRDITYYAIGVGEEDTTLLDSLKSILAEEGVTTTEEDDMSSLITKVDNEFNDKNNEINGLNTTITNKNNEINDMKQDLTNALVNKGLNVNTGSSFDEIIGSIGNINNYIAKAGSTYKIINIANHTAGRLLMDTYLELTNVLLIVPGTYTVSFELYTGSYDEIGGSTNSSPGYCRVQHVRGSTVVSTVDKYSTKYPGETFNININNVKTGDQIYIYGKTANTSRFYNVRNIIISCSL